MTPEKRKMVQSYRESIYGPSVFTREDDCLHIDGVPVAEAGRFPIDQTDKDFFSSDAYEKLILNKTVDENGQPTKGLLTDEEYEQLVYSTLKEPDDSSET